MERSRTLNDTPIYLVSWGWHDQLKRPPFGSSFSLYVKLGFEELFIGWEVLEGQVFVKAVVTITRGPFVVTKSESNVITNR